MKKILSIILLFTSLALSQNDPPGDGGKEGGFLSDLGPYIKLTGEAGTYGELYSISGMTSRRPPKTGRIFLRPTLILFDNIKLAFDLFLSTEGNSAKQQMDQLAVHPSWGWGQAHIGDFTHELSKYTLSGVNIRGLGVEFFPGIFRIHLLGGQTQRAVAGTPFESAYARYIYAMKLGFGKKESSHIDLNLMRASDDVKSVSRDRFMQIQQDSVLIGGVYTPKTDTIFSGVTPQENLVIGTNFLLKILNGVVQMRGEAAGSIYTKDMYSENYQTDQVPDIAKSIYRSRISTSADYAYNADVTYQQRGYNAKVGYKVIGPGYTSLGLASVINDKRIIDGAIGFQLLKGMITVRTTYANQRDNLLDQKINTTTRNDFSLNTSVRPITELMLSLNYVNNNLENDAKNDTFKLDNTNHSYNFTGTYQFELFKLKQILLTTYAYQTFNDNNILRQGNGAQSQNIILNLTTIIDQTWNTSLGFQMNTVTVQNEDKSTFGFSGRVSQKMFNGQLNNSLSYSFNTSSVSNTNNIQVGSNYSVTQSSAIVLNVRTTFFSGKPPAQYNFTEIIGSLGYSYRF
ncbi:MAG: hypothetical protein HUU54_07915 [Ignavibacteriaceae bacterium]|nr:hypothetical protein [Ignavibacteriaceae bacterium]